MTDSPQPSSPERTLADVLARPADHHAPDADADLTRTLAAVALHLGARLDALTAETRRWARALEAIDARIDARRNGPAAATRTRTTP